VTLTYIREALSELTEIDKARAVSERAVKTINFREEQEKFNVWVARLNLENLYGSRETLMSKLEEACTLNDVKKMHLLDVKKMHVKKMHLLDASS
jgi:rRNA biogenesis protein RRP5